MGCSQSDEASKVPALLLVVATQWFMVRRSPRTGEKLNEERGKNSKCDDAPGAILKAREGGLVALREGRQAVRPLPGTMGQYPYA